MTEPASPRAALRQIVDELRTIEIVAGQCSVESPEIDTKSLMAEAEARRCGNWADRLDAVLATLSASAPLSSPSPGAAIAKLMRGLIKRYVSHHRACASRQQGPRQECSCGLDGDYAAYKAALAASESAPNGGQCSFCGGESGPFVASDDLCHSVCKGCIEAYAAFMQVRPPESAPATTPWRPIETAPKDGTQILACDIGGVLILEYRPSVRSFVDGQARCWAPTHWMPLPAPPASRAAEPPSPPQVKP